MTDIHNRVQGAEGLKNISRVGGGTTIDALTLQELARMRMSAPSVVVMSICPENASNEGGDTKC